MVVADIRTMPYHTRGASSVQDGGSWSAPVETKWSNGASRGRGGLPWCVVSRGRVRRGRGRESSWSWSRGRHCVVVESIVVVVVVVVVVDGRGRRGRTTWWSWSWCIVVVNDGPSNKRWSWYTWWSNGRRGRGRRGTWSSMTVRGHTWSFERPLVVVVQWSLCTNVVVTWSSWSWWSWSTGGRGNVVVQLVVPAMVVRTSWCLTMVHWWSWSMVVVVNAS